MPGAQRPCAILKDMVDLARGDFAFRPLRAGETESLLRAVLAATEDGMLLTDLDHESIACNRRFGELFGVPWRDVVSSSVGDLRQRVLPLIVDPARWLASLEEVYADPACVLHDDLLLNRGGRVILRRYSSPVTDGEGQIVARLWTFRDVTAERRQLEFHRVLGELSSFQNPDPNVVCERILESVSNFFDGTTAVLSIRRGDMLDFKGVVGEKSVLHRIPGNAMRDSYCQYALEGTEPFLIQNAKKEAKYCRVRPARSGLTRYLGAPLFDESGQGIGTICILDRRSQDPLGDSDIHFMSLVAMRLSSELIRERHIRERLAEKDVELRKQEEDLIATTEVFESMNAAFGLLAEQPETDHILREQARTLGGLLGYESAAVLLRESGSTSFRGYARAAGAARPVQVAFENSDLPCKGSDSDCAVAKKLRSSFLSFELLTEVAVGEVLLILGRATSPPEDDRHRIHLKALADQVCLLLSTHVLHDRLVRTHAELQATQDELLQKEKLSVAGTLAASTAHDVRNITASLALLASPGAADPEVALEAVREQLRRFDVLAHRLLSYAKPRMAAAQAVDVKGILDAVLRLTEGQVRVGRVIVEKKVPSSLPPVLADLHQLEHLFVNLILNAVQAMDTVGGGTLTVSAAVKGEFVKLRFVDSGPGIPKELLSSLFQPFSSKRANGFGLGLYSCKRIAEAHGGTIEASRNAIRGSTFTLTLPIGNR